MLTHYVGSIAIQASALFYQACIYTNNLYLVVTHEDDLHKHYSLLITHNQRFYQQYKKGAIFKLKKNCQCLKLNIKIAWL